MELVQSSVNAIGRIGAYLLFLLGLAFTQSAASAGDADLENTIEDLKAEVIELNRELFELEEQLLYPATTSFAVFVSMDSVKNFELTSVKLELDQAAVTSHLYDHEQVDALRRGGIQKLFQGNLKPGMHNVKALIQGKDSDGRPVQRTVVADFGKARSTKYLEVKISQNPKKQRPEFAIVEWK